jgi:hypothetical protein
LWCVVILGCLLGCLLGLAKINLATALSMRLGGSSWVRRMRSLWGPVAVQASGGRGIATTVCITGSPTSATYLLQESSRVFLCGRYVGFATVESRVKGKSSEETRGARPLQNYRMGITRLHSSSRCSIRLMPGSSARVRTERHS